MVSICFVCLGNICRSPTAEGVMQHLIESENLDRVIELDSAGTGAWHVGEPADRRARQTAKSRGLELTSRARKFEARDFDRFDYVIAMDRSNQTDLQRLAKDQTSRDKVHLFRSFEPSADSPDTPDPYYGGPEGFDRVFDICERACRGLLQHVRKHHDL